MTRAGDAEDDEVDPGGGPHAGRPVEPARLDYAPQLPILPRPEPFGWKDVAVIVFILLGPILLWILSQVVGLR